MVKTEYIIRVVFFISLGYMSLYLYFTFTKYIFNVENGGEKLFQNSRSTCFVQPCPKIYDNFINIHIIPTNDLDFWMLEEEYNGTIGLPQETIFKNLFDSVLEALISNPFRTFIIAELVHFQKWWNGVDDSVKMNLRTLIDRGQLQFVSGGLVINDEASTHYSSIIEQLAFGLNFIKNNFGECNKPFVGWQIGIYGHSREMADILRQMGFKALFLNHIPKTMVTFFYADQDHEFLWKTSDNHNNNSNTNTENTIFTSILYENYCLSNLFCMQEGCKNDNIPFFEAVYKFTDFIHNKILLYKTKNIIIPLGCKFDFQPASDSFLKFEKIMEHINVNQNIFKVFYSTPFCYLSAVTGSVEQMKIYEQDFFPYDDALNQFWIGFYTSRPTLKFNIRLAENAFQTCKKVSSLSDKHHNKYFVDLLNYLTNMSAIFSMLQHYRIIAGTSTSSVVKRHLDHLFRGLDICLNLTAAGIESVMSFKISYEEQIELTDCPLLNISYCLYTDDMKLDQSIDLIIFNPLPYVHSKWIFLPVTIDEGQTYEVTDVWRTILKVNIIPIDKSVLSMKERPKSSKATFNVLFKAEIPEMGFTIFKVKKKSSEFWDLSENFSVIKFVTEQKIFLSNSVMNLTLDVNTNKITVMKESQKFTFYLNLKCYCTFFDDGSSASDLYVSVFKKIPKHIKSRPTSFVLNGSLVKEIRRRYSKSIGYTIRLYEGESTIEVEWIISGIKRASFFNREYALTYRSERQLRSFYTDSNGRQLITRNFKTNRSLESNFYPITSHVLFNNILDEGMVIHSDRSLGVGATNFNTIELIVNRIILTKVNAKPKNSRFDNDFPSVIGKNWIEFGDFEQLRMNRRILSNEIFNRQIVLMINSSIGNFYLKFHKNLRQQPKHLNVLSLEPILDYNSNMENHLLRLENLKDISGDGEINKINILKINLQNLFENYEIVQVVEMNLSGDKESKSLSKLNGFMIKLHPMEIITLKIRFSDNNN